LILVGFLKSWRKKKTIDIFNRKKLQKRNRSGYDTDSMLLYKKCSVLQFVETENPVEILGQYNQIVFDIVNIGENLQIMKMFEKQPETTEEIKNCLNDLKVLNSKDFKGLLKWREKMKKINPKRRRIR